MRLVSVEIENFRNITVPQTVEIEHDVTGLVGKNESGKTTVLIALHRLNPANLISSKFDLTIEYPRWKLAADRRSNDRLASTCPVSAVFELTDDDRDRLASTVGLPIPGDTKCRAARDYENHLEAWFLSSWEVCRDLAISQSTLSERDQLCLGECSDFEELKELAATIGKGYRDAKDSGKASGVKNFVAELGKLQFLFDDGVENGEADSLAEELLPKFFYFSAYNNLPGECNLTQLKKKIDSKSVLGAGEHTLLSLLARAGVRLSDLLDDDYESRSAELQAVGWDLTREVFEYWKQNQDLEVVLNIDNVEKKDTDGQLIGTERILKIELSDARHGNVRTNFSTRSTGFQWFFSFFAAFSRYQNSGDSIVVLLDEPGTSLHGEAQKDFLNFIYDDLGSHTQTLYTTHSQFMVDPARYEKLRAVHDTASKNNRDGGVAITDISLSADKDTVLPVESSLGYSISQHLFIGSGHHLAVEGSSDFVYIQRLSEYLISVGRKGLDPQFSMIPVGGIDNMPAFVALLGRRLKVSALIDGASSSKAADRVRRAAQANGVKESSIFVCSSVDPDLPLSADIEDLFAEADYLKLFGWTFPTYGVLSLPETKEPILRKIETAIGGKIDHARPAHTLTDRRDEFFGSVAPVTLDRFESLFEALNGTLL